jgi:catechol 2,3-dioxygenase
MAIARPYGPSVNHLVFTVRDLEASHKFYTEVIGFQKHGELARDLLDAIGGTRMWFYQGHPDAHHDLALVQAKGTIEPAQPWGGFFPEAKVGINHVAIGYPTREEWLARIKHIQESGVQFVIRGNHGMTHSAYVSDPDGNGIEVLYEVPKEVWEDDINGALNYFEFMPTDGPESLVDDLNYHQFEPAS